MITIKQIFDEQFSHVKFDRKLAKELYNYQLSFLKTKDHLEFIGGNLLGVQQVRFKDRDVLKLFDILDVDFSELSHALKKATNVNQNYKISSDVFNLSIFYMLHRFEVSDLDDGSKHRAKYDCAMLFNYRTIAALISNGFRYKTDPAVMQIAYSNLSNKFLIKRLGSWGKVFDYRSNDLIGKDSIHLDTINKFDDDFSIIYAINDAQGRIRDIFKSYYSEFMKVHQSGLKIQSTASSSIDKNGDERIMEKVGNIESVVNDIMNTLNEEHAFIKDDLVSVISSSNVNTSTRSIRMVLLYLVDNYHDHSHAAIEDFVKGIIIYTFALLKEHASGINRRDYSKLLELLKNLYLSSRTEEPELLRLRDLGETIVRDALEHGSKSLIYSTRTSIILYISLLAIIKGS